MSPETSSENYGMGELFTVSPETLNKAAEKAAESPQEDSPAYKRRVRNVSEIDTSVRSRIYPKMLLLAALDLADGDHRRLTYNKDGSITVENRPRQDPGTTL